MGNGFIEQGFFTSSYNNLLGLWPAGIPLIHSALIFFGGLDIKPIPIFYFSLISIWAFIFTTFFFNTLRYKNNAGKLIIVLLFFYLIQSDLFSLFFLRQSVILSEGISTPAFILSLYYLFNIYNGKNNLFLALFFILISSFTRATSDLFVSLLSFFYILYLIPNIIKSPLFMNYQSQTLVEILKFIFANGRIFLFLFLYFLITSPYKLVMNQNIGEFSLVTKNFNFSHAWMPDHYLDREGGGFVIHGGGNVACLIDEVQCKIIYEEEMLKDNPYSNYKYLRDQYFLLIIENPINWISLKVKYFIKYWLATPPDVASVSKSKYENLITLIIILSILFSILRFLYLYNLKKLYKFRGEDTFLFTVLPLAVLITFILPQFLIHFEARYFYPIKIYLFFLFPLFLFHQKLIEEKLERL